MFDSYHGRTCLHYAAYYGHSDCVQAFLSAAHSTPVANSWGFARFVNVRDGSGATPLHLAARQKQPECIHILLENGALVSASTGGYGYTGSTSLHLAARGSSWRFVGLCLGIACMGSRSSSKEFIWVDLLRGQKSNRVDVTLQPEELDALDNVLAANNRDLRDLNIGLWQFMSPPVCTHGS